MVALNVLGDVELIRLGRGQYRQAVALMLAESDAGPIRVGSDHDYRNPLLLAHYAGERADGARFQYLRASQLSQGAVDWFIAHRLYGQAAPPPRGVVAKQPFALRAVFPTGAQVGIAWYVYRKAGAPAARP